MTEDGTALTKELCDRLHGVTWDALAPEVQQKLLLCLQDHVACVFGGAETEWGRLGVQYARSLGGNPQSSLLAVGGRVPAELAAFSNCHMANMLDYDDTNLDLGHPGGPVWAASLAASELAGAPPRRFLAAAFAGYELGMRLALATRPSDERFRQIYPTPWKGAAAATAAGIALGLDSDQLRSAIGISFILGPMASAMTPETTFAFKAGQMGQYAEAGVKAAIFAQMGFIGKRNLFGRDVPLATAMGSDRYDLQWMQSDEYVFPTVSFKPYPACRFTHTAIEAAEQAVESGLRPADLKTVTLQTFERAMQLRSPEPANFADGPFCLPYVVALALSGVEPGPWWYDDARLHDAEIIALARRITLRVDPVINELTDQHGKLPARLVISTHSGQEHEFYVENPLGEPDRPVTQARLDRKFHALVSPALGTRDTERLLAAIQALPESLSMQGLLDLATSRHSEPVPARV
jgi:2-methylcitrate dehydratase PrpD